MNNRKNTIKPFKIFIYLVLITFLLLFTLNFAIFTIMTGVNYYSNLPLNIRYNIMLACIIFAVVYTPDAQM
jgi:hypothetical protein